MSNLKNSIERLEKWAVANGYSIKVGHLSEIIKELKEAEKYQQPIITNKKDVDDDDFSLFRHWKDVDDDDFSLFRHWKD